MSATDYDEDGSCIICYEDMVDFDSSRLNCGHRFHTDVRPTLVQSLLQVCVTVYLLCLYCAVY